MGVPGGDPRRGVGGVGGRGASSLGGQGTAAAPQRCEELPTALQHALAELDDATAADMQEEVEVRLLYILHHHRIPF